MAQWSDNTGAKQVQVARGMEVAEGRTMAARDPSRGRSFHAATIGGV